MCVQKNKHGLHCVFNIQLLHSQIKQHKYTLEKMSVQFVKQLNIGIGIGPTDTQIFSPKYRNIGHRAFYSNRPNSTALCSVLLGKTTSL